MNHSASDQSFYIESDEEDDNKDYHHDDDGSHSDASEDDDETQQQNRPSSYTSAWPQSYRQSMDLYSSVPSPGIGFLANSSLSRFGSSFLSSSFIRRHTPESLAAVTKPLISEQADEQPQPKQRRGSYSSMPPPIPSRRHSMRTDEIKTSMVSHEIPMSRNSSFGQAVMNGLNVLCGVGLLSTPYAVKEGGWLGLLILLTFAILSFYTGLLLRHCLDSEPGLQTYPDIGQAAFGTNGRFIISIILYLELYASCVEYIILEGDNLSSLFPNASLNIGGFHLDPHHLFALLVTLAVLPTVWLRDLRILSYISVGGVISTVVVIICLYWTGLVDNINTHSKGTPLNLPALPVAIGLYGFCYSGHAVFPNIYTSMAKPSQFPAVLFTSFGIATVMYGSVAVMGYKMFGEATQSQITLNMPQDLIASKIAVWTTVINPFSKFALTISPVALSLEELIPSRHKKSHLYAIGIRSLLVFSTLLVGLAIPFFGLVMSLIGSFLSMLTTLILPPACFLSILRGKVSTGQIMLCVVIITVGGISSVFGTYSALSKIIHQLIH